MPNTSKRKLTATHVTLEKLKALIGGHFYHQFTLSLPRLNRDLPKAFRMTKVFIYSFFELRRYFIVSALGACVYLLIGLFLPKAFALTMSNTNYTIDLGNLNSFSGEKSNGQYTVNDTGGQIAPGLYAGPNYTLRAGFQYINSIIKFSFKINPLVIDFGALSPGTFVTRAQNFTVSNGSAYGYVVTVAENHSLLVPATGAMIPNTSCNSGTCTTSTAGLWDSSLVFGFGIRCEYSVGSTCASDFNGTNFYRPLADLSNGQTAQTIASSSNVVRNQVENLTYKINVSQSQAAGQYTNQVIFIATPTF